MVKVESTAEDHGVWEANPPSCALQRLPETGAPKVLFRAADLPTELASNERRSALSPPGEARCTASSRIANDKLFTNILMQEQAQLATRGKICEGMTTINVVRAVQVNEAGRKAEESEAASGASFGLISNSIRSKEHPRCPPLDNASHAQLTTHTTLRTTRRFEHIVHKQLVNKEVQ